MKCIECTGSVLWVMPSQAMDRPAKLDSPRLTISPSPYTCPGVTKMLSNQHWYLSKTLSCAARQRTVRTAQQSVGHRMQRQALLLLPALSRPFLPAQDLALVRFCAWLRPSSHVHPSPPLLCHHPAEHKQFELQEDASMIITCVLRARIQTKSITACDGLSFCLRLENTAIRSPQMRYVYRRK